MRSLLYGFDFHRTLKLETSQWHRCFYLLARLISFALTAWQAAIPAPDHPHANRLLPSTQILRVANSPDHICTFFCVAWKRGRMPPHVYTCIAQMSLEFESTKTSCMLTTSTNHLTHHHTTRVSRTRMLQTSTEYYIGGSAAMQQDVSMSRWSSMLRMRGCRCGANANARGMLMARGPLRPLTAKARAA